VTGLDQFGRIIDIPYKPDPGAPAVLQYQYGYDDAGRQNSVTDPGGIVTLTQYDDIGRPVLSSLGLIADG
jgi:hypothetical protein